MADVYQSQSSSVGKQLPSPLLPPPVMPLSQALTQWPVDNYGAIQGSIMACQGLSMLCRTGHTTTSNGKDVYNLFREATLKESLHGC